MMDQPYKYIRQKTDKTKMALHSPIIMLSFLVGILPLLAHSDRIPTILLAMIARNEEDNFRANLPKWAAVVDAMVCGIDDRTNDNTHLAVIDSLPNIPHWLYYYQFDGFGTARTRVFREGWRKFPEMTHVLIADPDWEPQLPISKAEIDFNHITFQFKIYDRNAHTTRISDWLVLHTDNLTFTHRLHEQLHLPPITYEVESQSKSISWEVREVEVKTRRSWHNSQVDHGHSQSFNRYLFDINLLEQDYAEMPDDSHVLYYLGTTHFAALEALLGRGQHQVTPEVTKWIDNGLKYLNLRLQDHHINDKNAVQEQTWAAMRWLAYAYQNFQFSFEKSEYWYRRCIEFDPPRADCPVFLSKLYRQHGLANLGWEVISETLKTPKIERHFSDNFYVYECCLPLEASLTLLDLITNHQGSDQELSPTFFFGWKLLRKAQTSCNSPTLGFLQESEEIVEAAEASYKAIANHRPGEPSPLDLMDQGEVCARAAGTSPDLITMLKQWGVKFCVE